MKTQFLTALTSILLLVAGSCKKETKEVTTIIDGHTISHQDSNFRKGWIDVDFGNAELISLLEKNNIDINTVIRMNATLRTISLINPARKDSLTFDDIDSIQFYVAYPKMDGDPIRTGDVKLGSKMKRSVSENTDVSLSVSPRQAGDPIKLGDVKLGMRIKLLRDFFPSAGIQATIQWGIGAPVIRRL